MKATTSLLLIFGIALLTASCQLIGKLALGKQKNFDKFTKENSGLYGNAEKTREKETEENLWRTTHTSVGPYEDKIQEQFGKFLASQCNCAPTYNAQIDYIPSALRPHLYDQDLKTTEITVFEKVSLANILLTPIDESRKTALKNGSTTDVFSKVSPLNVIVDYYKNPVSPGVGKSNFFYSATCSNYLDAKLSVGGGNQEASKNYLKAVLQAESKNRAALIGYGGFFESPIAIALTIPSYRTFINGSLWNLYASSSSAYDLTSTKKLYYVSGVEGSTFSRSTLSEKKFLLEGKGALNASISVVEVDASVKAGLTGDQLTATNNYDTYLLSKLNDASFQPFDNPSQIIDYYAGLTPTFSNNGYNEEFFENKIHTLSIEYRGIPDPLCSQDYWNVNNPIIKMPGSSERTVYNNTPTLTTDRTPSNGCLFKVSGIANKDFFNNPASKTNLLRFDLALTSKNSVEGAHLQLFMKEVTTYTNLDPSLPTVSVPPFSKKGANHSCEFDAQFSDSQNIVDYTRNPNSVLVESVVYSDDALKNVQTPQVNATAIAVSNNKFFVTLSSLIQANKIDADQSLTVPAKLVIRISFYTKATPVRPAALIDRYITVHTYFPKPTIQPIVDIVVPLSNTVK